MHTSPTVILDEHDRHQIGRVVPVVPVAFPTAADLIGGRTVSPGGRRRVDDRDPRLRVLRAWATHPGHRIDAEEAHLTHQALTDLLEVLATQTDSRFWLDLTDPAREPGPDEIAMAEAMAAERHGQTVRTRQALQVADQALALLHPTDAPPTR